MGVGEDGGGKGIGVEGGRRGNGREIGEMFEGKGKIGEGDEMDFGLGMDVECMEVEVGVGWLYGDEWGGKSEGC